MPMTTVMVFGTFDGIHEGHRAMIQEARQHGSRLIAVVPQDHIVERFKGRLPEASFDKRFEGIQAEEGVDRAVIGDADHGTWHVIHHHQPDVIAVGYDQDDMYRELIRLRNTFPKNPKIVILHSFEPHKYKSSIVNEHARR